MACCGHRAADVFGREVVPSALADQEPGIGGNSKRIGSHAIGISTHMNG